MFNHRLQSCGTSHPLNILSGHHTGLIGISCPCFDHFIIILFVHLLRSSCGQQ
jgi:hypothetical protein